MRLRALGVLLLALALLGRSAAATPALQLFSSSSTSEIIPGEQLELTLSLYASAPAGVATVVELVDLPEGLQLVATRASGGSWVDGRWAGVAAYDQPITLELELVAAADMPTSSTPREICATAVDELENHVQSCVVVRVDQRAPYPRPRTNVFIPLVLH